jgi:Peptidase M50B-like
VNTNIYALVAAIAIGVLLVLYPVTWKYIRHGVTLVHEVGHAVFGLVSGASLSGIVLKRDSSGVTTTAHSLSNNGVSLFITYSAGYPAPALFGSISLVSAYLGYHRIGWIMLALMGTLCLAFSRSFFTVFVSLVFAGLTGLLAYFNLEGGISSAILSGVGTLLVIGGIKTVVELTSLTRHKKDEGSDARALAELTHTSRWIWLGMMWIYTGVGIALPVFIGYALTR